jgi:hypothetical protein
VAATLDVILTCDIMMDLEGSIRILRVWLFLIYTRFIQFKSHAHVVTSVIEMSVT